MHCGENGEGSTAVIDEGEPGKRFTAAAMSMTAAEARGEGTAEPVDMYNGLSSSGIWAKKQTLLLQLTPSLQSLVLY